jgi:hypothetical protein
MPIVGALGVFFLVLIFSDDYDVGLNLAVVVECGHLGAYVFVQREFGLSHEKSPRCPILRFGQLGRFLRMEFRKALTH